MSFVTYSLSPAEGFVAGALAAGVAVTITNPVEVAKTRFQMNGHTNIFDVFKQTIRTEGIWSCQRGLGLAYAYQFALNGSRLGFYEPIRRVLASSAGQNPSNVQLWSCASAGVLCGSAAAILSHPLLLLKAHFRFPALVSPTFATTTTVTHKPSHLYRSPLGGLTQFLRQAGYKGWTRGADAALLKVALAGSVQLPAYNLTQTQLSCYFGPDFLWRYAVSSSFAAMCGLAVIQPVDTVMAKMKSQPSNPANQLYKNPLHCAWSTIQNEGLLGIYKGSATRFVSFAPPIIVTLGAYEIIVYWWSERMLRAREKPAE